MAKVDATGYEVEEMADGWILFTFHDKSGKTCNYQFVEGTLNDYIEIAEAIKPNLTKIREHRRSKQVAELSPDFSGPIKITDKMPE